MQTCEHGFTGEQDAAVDEDERSSCCGAHVTFLDHELYCKCCFAEVTGGDLPGEFEFEMEELY